MKKIILLPAILVLALFAGGCSLSSTNNAAPTSPAAINQTPAPISPTVPAPAVSTVSAQQITIQNFAFSPANLTVAKGTKITWTNQDSAPHQLQSTAFNSPAINQGQSYSFTFNTAGTFDYICSIHPSMKGQIIVQ